LSSPWLQAWPGQSIFLIEERVIQGNACCLTSPLDIGRFDVHRHDPNYVMDLATRVFGDAAKANEWLNLPRVQLGGGTPLEALSTEDGARRVEELLAQIDDDKRLGIS
jgi:hypothetical protein